MTKEFDVLKIQLVDINHSLPTVTYSATNVSVGLPIPKIKRVQLFSPAEWEEFIAEWANSLKEDYRRVAKLSGSGDMGLDVVGFDSDLGFQGEWDNYQCKHYAKPLAPSDIWVEIGKLIYYTFLGDFTVPRRYYFVASKDVGTTLQRLLGSADKLKAEMRGNWPTHCENGITSKQNVKLVGDLEKYFNEFDYTIFSTKSVNTLIEEHAKTPHHAVRFGGGLPLRGDQEVLPQNIQSAESNYVNKIIKAYADVTNEPNPSIEWIQNIPNLLKDLNKQRERFYHAESLKNFSRDTVPEGTFESLQQEIHDGVIDVCESEFSDGFERMKEVISKSTQLQIDSNPLLSVIKTKDRQGICHQLANQDRLDWVKDDDAN